MLYTWIVEENNLPKERKSLLRVANPPEHPKNPPLEIKLEAINRCVVQGESIKYASEELGYSRGSIYQWRKRYLKEGAIGFMDKKNIPAGELNEGIKPAETTIPFSQEIEALKTKMLDMQMEIDILKETINV